MIIKSSTTCKYHPTHDVLTFEEWVTAHEIPCVFPELPFDLWERQFAAREQNGLHFYMKTDRDILYVSVLGYGFWFVNKMAGVAKAMEDDRVSERRES
mgnify:CR=1 FL=1|jgi:hypothetical protein